jgi:hypothetical protein
MKGTSLDFPRPVHTHTHTHTHIYIYIYIGIVNVNRNSICCGGGNIVFRSDPPFDSSGLHSSLSVTTDEGRGILRRITLLHVRFEVFTAVTMKNGVFWDVTPCGSCKNRRFGGT